MLQLPLGQRAVRTAAARAFEFQIMPQLLSALRPHEIGGVGEIDWGTLAVYTCTKSCEGAAAAAAAAAAAVDGCEDGDGKESRYIKEVVWRQAL